MRDDTWKPAADAAMDRYAEGGDEAAFAEVYTLLAPRLLAFLLRRTRDHARSEELVHETFLRMHLNRRHFARGAQVTPWAFAITRRMLIDDHRKCHAPHEAERPSSPGVDALVSLRRVGDRILEALQQLPEQHREAFALVQLDGLSMAEAAEVLGTTVPAVKLRAHRTYVALRELLGDEVHEALGDLP
ncbi:MAG TPA: RNA polymerase sigma factor [Polyangiaceae bacterium]|jgi:RNA polymerase sigma-70 factor (ECF subfamily)